MRGSVRSPESAAGLCAKCRVNQKHRTRTGKQSEWCRVCINVAGRQYRETHRTETRKAGREHARRKKYGLEHADCIEWLASQGNRCAICRVGLSMDPHTQPIPHIDHDHETERLRGILCINCNRLLGVAFDSIGILQAAIAYLRAHGKR